MGRKHAHTFIAFVFVAGLATVVLLTHGGASKKTVTNTVNTNTAASLVAIANKTLLEDSDNDGLPDWEETLRKTDPHNPDTDGNGVLDGKEKYKDTTIQARVEQTIQELDKASSHLTETQKFGRELLAQYLELKKEGKKFDATAVTKFTERLASDVNQGVEIILFTAKDIQTVLDTSPAALKEYANRMGRILTRNTPANIENELTVATRALENKDKEELKKIDPLVQSFESTVQEALTIPVPANLAEKHIQLLNAFVYMKTTLAGLQQIFDDPLTGFVRISQHQQSVRKLRAALQDIKDFFQKNNIQFNDSDEGAVLVNTE